MFARELPTFSIFDHLNKLQIVRQTRTAIRAICPICGGNNLEITTSGKTAGRYACYSNIGCTSEQIREAIAPLLQGNAPGSEAFEKAGSHYRGLGRRINLRVLPAPLKLYKPVLLPAGEIVLATLPEDVDVLPIVQKGLNTEIIYHYSCEQWVLRTDFYNEAGERTHKTTKPWHINADSKNVNSKGEKPWPIYRIHEAEQFAVDQWVLGVEGEKSVEAARFLGICTVTWMGSAWSDVDLESGLISLKKAGVAGLIYWPDNDEIGVKKALAIANAAAKIQFPCLVLNPLELWEEMPEKGDIADWVAANGDWSREQFIAIMNRLIGQTADKFTEKLVNWDAEFIEYGGDGGNHRSIIESWCEAEFSDLVAEKYRDQLAWNVEEEQWYRYSANIDGIWGLETSNAVSLICEIEIKPYKYYFCDKYGRPHPISHGFTSGVERKLRAKLAVKEWDEITGFIPMTNGLLNPSTLELTPHCPGNRLTWCLPYQYSAIATCPPIEAWFNSQVQDQGTIDVLRAYFYAVATGKSEWQQYLEIIGKGGTGKGTYTRLAQALVGLRNTHSTKLQKLEKSNFESASLKGKRLCVITDSERFAGEVSILKAMTGSDLIPYEVKGKQSTSGFIYPGMIIIAGNEAISSSDYTSGTERRRIGVRFDQQVERKDQQILLDFRTNGEMFGEFAGYIPGLLNWVLSMGEVRAKELLKNHCEASQLLCQQKATMLTETNPLAAWADEELVQETGYRNYVGIAQQIRFTTGDMGQSESWTAYRNANTWLYPNYCQYAQNTGTNPLSQKRFTSLLLDLLQAQLKLPISKGTDRKGSYFEGIRIRTGSDDDISTLITKLSELEPNNSDFNTESEKCDGSCDGLVMDNVMPRPILQQACDGCDGKIDNYSIENENIKNTLSMNTGTALQGNLAFNPSQPITQVVAEVSKTLAVIEVEANVMGESVPSQLQELQQSGEVANTETEKAEEFINVIAERNNKFPIGSYVYYKDSRFKGFGDLGSKRLCQVIAHLDWCPEHIQVKGKGVEGIVACADCKPLTRYEELKLGLSRK
ncbi:MAG: hypothetical protein HEQ25_06015 [Dolichospermum sp. DET73]|nr:hypothetical protein [Dolichospermum sp. DET73]